MLVGPRSPAVDLDGDGVIGIGWPRGSGSHVAESVCIDRAGPQSRQYPVGSVDSRPCVCSVLNG